MNLFSHLKRKVADWPTTVGWTIFLILTAALLSGHYVFDPFAFGFAYYVVLSLYRSKWLGAARGSPHRYSWELMKDRPHHELTSDIDELRERLLLVSIICVLYVGLHVYQGVNHGGISCAISSEPASVVPLRTPSELGAYVTNFNRSSINTFKRNAMTTMTTARGTNLHMSPVPTILKPR
jgi:hypothetical protein